MVSDKQLAAIRGLSAAVLAHKSDQELPDGALAHGFAYVSAEGTSLLREVYESGTNPDTSPPDRVELLTHSPLDDDGDRRTATQFTLEGKMLRVQRATDLDTVGLGTFMKEAIKRAGLASVQVEPRGIEDFLATLSELAERNTAKPINR